MRIEQPEEVRSLFAHYLALHPDPVRHGGDDWLDQYLPIDRTWLRQSQALVA
jgi:hypothetical protein